MAMNSVEGYVIDSSKPWCPPYARLDTTYRKWNETRSSSRSEPKFYNRVREKQRSPGMLRGWWCDFTEMRIFIAIVKCVVIGWFCRFLWIDKWSILFVMDNVFGCHFSLFWGISQHLQHLPNIHLFEPKKLDLKTIPSFLGTHFCFSLVLTSTLVIWWKK